jgi:ankyrin repeat protein/truncated hemoglobin YjbI
MTAPRGLFESLGGRAGVAALVDALYDRLERDPELTRLFRSRRSGERQRLSEFFETIFGGAVRGARDVGMQRRHIHRFISEAESQLWLAHFSAAMVSLEIDEDARKSVMEMLRGPAARLVNAGAPLAVLDKAFALATKGDSSALAELVRHDPRLINQRGRDGVTLLWIASRRGNLPLVRLLVDAGADMDIPGSLVHATQVMVSPYCIAVRSGREDVARYLLAQGAQYDVFSAAYLGDVQALATHIAEGRGDLQSPDEDLHPVTPLQHAVDGGSIAAVRLLLESGADAIVSGGRLLTSAAHQGVIEIVRLLLDHGAEAAKAESLGAVGIEATIGRLLVEHGFNLDAPIRDQETLLTRACRADKGEHPETVSALLALGADPNAPNAKGHTPLARATAAGFSRSIELLIAAGAH